VRQVKGSYLGLTSLERQKSRFRLLGKTGGSLILEGRVM
jgi:hypothetical protein